MNGYDYPEGTAATANVTLNLAKTVSLANTAPRLSILDENAQALDTLATLLMELEDRLNPILRHEFDMAEAGDRGHPEPPATTIRIQLNTLRSQAQRVKAILDRLEV